MYSLKPFKIALKGLKEGVTSFEYALDADFFAAVEAQDISSGSLCVTLSIRRAINTFELDFAIQGTIQTPCTQCLEDMELPIDTTFTQMVKLGNEEIETDELIVIDDKDGALDVSWLIYEAIALDIPIVHVHPPGRCNAEMIEKIQALSADRSSESECSEQEAIDPRWSKLQEIRNNKL